MAWIDFDWLDFERDEFKGSVRTVIVEVFEKGIERLEHLWKEQNQKLTEEAEQAKGEEDRDIAWHLVSWEEYLHQQRQQALGSLALDWLMSSLHGRLNELKKYFDKSHPAAPPYKGDGWLSKMRQEYLSRFGIDFSRSERFATMEELVLARNAGIHRDNPGVIAEYRKKVREPGFIDSNGEFEVTRGKFQQVVSDAEDFVGWVVDELKSLREASKRIQ